MSEAVAERARLERRPEAIRSMFAAVARRYDLLNHLLSLRRDVAWRRLLVRALDAAPPGPVLDLATGTGDVALAIGDRRVVGGDFCVEMLALARAKARRRDGTVAWLAADALALPFRDGSFAAATVAFGVRNFSDLAAGLAAIHRLLRDDGLLAILELHRPLRPLVGAFASLWQQAVVRPVGGLLSDDGGAYRYLPTSVDSFADRRELAARLEAAGFGILDQREVAGGIAAVTVGRRTEEG